MDRLRGVCGPKDLDRLAAKLLALDELPPAKLATRRWIVSETTIKCVFRTAKCDACRSAFASAAHVKCCLAVVISMSKWALCLNSGVQPDGAAHTVTL